MVINAKEKITVRQGGQEVLRLELGESYFTWDSSEKHY